MENGAHNVKCGANLEFPPQVVGAHEAHITGVSDMQEQGLFWVATFLSNLQEILSMIFSID